MTFGGHHPQGVLQRGNDGREIFPGGFFAAGQIEDKTVPATARESIARGVCFSPSIHMATGMALISRSRMPRVASGVTSLGERPVPPVVMIRSSCFSSAQAVSSARMAGISSGTMGGMDARIAGFFQH